MIIRKTGSRAFDVLRRGEARAKELGLNENTPENELVELMVQYPELLQRPIVEIGDRAVLARPIERAMELIRGGK